MDDVSSMVESSSKVRNVYILMEGPVPGWKHDIFWRTHVFGRGSGQGSI